jgi:hypothetical protein
MPYTKKQKRLAGAVKSGKSSAFSKKVAGHVLSAPTKPAKRKTKK